MIIRYKDFTIEQDRSCFVLTEYGIIKDGKRKGEVSIKDQIFPATLIKALEAIIYRTKRNDKSVLELSDAIEKIREIDKETLEGLKEII